MDLRPAIWALRHSALAAIGLLGLALLISCQANKPQPVAPGDGPVRLAVLVVFDQLRGDYLIQWDDLFGPDGFQRLDHDGAWFQNCHYPYAGTVTGAGHASLATGCIPATHGIVGNNWFEPRGGGEVYCATTERYRQVPPEKPEQPMGDAPVKKKPKGGATPERMLAPTVADVLKETTGGAGKVVALSLKDRSSVLPGGKMPDLCLWIDHNTGGFVTSNYYADHLPSWLVNFNAAKPADQWFGKDWVRLRTDLDYTARSGPDDRPGEGKGAKQGVTFPHPMDGGKTSLGKDYYEAVGNSPFGNDLLLDLTKRAIAEEKLGADDVPDFLAISFSSNDLIGHCWGPESHEVLDVTLRSDRIMADLLAYLDEKVGKDRYVVVLSADHGICPLPEVAKAEGKDAGRISPKKLSTELHAFLDAKYGNGKEKIKWVKAVAESSIHLDHSILQAMQLDPAAVARVVADWMKTQPGIQTAYTRAQVEQMPAEDEIGQQVKRSYFAERSGDVLAVIKPYYLMSEPLATGTTHGAPHAYDTHVPLLVYGAGVVPSIRQERVTPQAAAAILAAGLKIKPPEKCEYPVPNGLFAD